MKLDPRIILLTDIITCFDTDSEKARKTIGKKGYFSFRLGNFYDLSTCDYNKKIPEILEKYNLDKESIKNYLIDVSNDRRDGRAFWYIQAPIKFEFLLTLFLYTCYGNEFEYKPNFKCDDSGIPYSHAPGNIGDIELKNKPLYHYYLLNTLLNL